MLIVWQKIAWFHVSKTLKLLVRKEVLSKREQAPAFIGQSIANQKRDAQPVRFHSHWNSAPNFNMQASFTYTPHKPTAAVCKGRKRLVVSRHSLLAEKNAKTLASLEPLHQISRCCSKQCFKQFDNIENLKQLRDTFFNFSNATLRKKFLKDLLLPNVPESMDYMDKQFEIGGFPICYMYAHKLFGVSNNLLTSVKGTPHAPASTHASRPSRAGVTFHNCDFTKREQVAMWLNHQKSFYDIQPDRDEVLLPCLSRGKCTNNTAPLVQLLCQK